MMIAQRTWDAVRNEAQRKASRSMLPTTAVFYRDAATRTGCVEYFDAHGYSLGGPRVQALPKHQPMLTMLPDRWWA